MNEIYNILDALALEKYTELKSQSQTYGDLRRRIDISEFNINWKQKNRNWEIDKLVIERIRDLYIQEVNKIMINF